MEKQNVVPVRFGWRVFWAWLTRGFVVVLLDHDGETNLRLGRTDLLGCPWAIRMGFGIRSVFLLPNGLVGNGSYAKEWIMYADYRKKTA